jgi:uncharacterized membrane protein YgdD (TMEM256/DUF423 family)
MNWTAIAALGLGVGVMLGAFGAHALRTRLDAYSMSVWERAVFYHFVHMLGLLVVPLLERSGSLSRGAREWVCWLLLAGVVLFCGSLYLLALTGVRALGAVTPLGGICFIAAWLLLAVALLRNNTSGHG